MKAINHFIGNKVKIIDVRRIRRFLEISPANRSKINFIWRNLELLEQHGIIQLYKKNPCKQYLLPNNLIAISYNKKGDIDYIRISTSSREKRENLYPEKANHII